MQHFSNRSRPKVELAWSHAQKEWWQHCQASTAVDSTRPQRKRATEEHMEAGTREWNVDGRFQIQLEEDGGGSAGQSWMETSCLWPMLHRQWQGISQVKSSLHRNEHLKLNYYNIKITQVILIIFILFCKISMLYTVWILHLYYIALCIPCTFNVFCLCGHVPLVLPRFRRLYPPRPPRFRRLCLQRINFINGN